MEKTNILVVGQGIAGSILAWELIHSGYQVKVINYETSDTSSEKAAGIYNPITGRNMIKTWLADKLFPGLEDYYSTLENATGCSFLYPKTIYRPFHNLEEQNDWAGKISDREYASYIKSIRTTSKGIAGVQDIYGGIELNYSGYVNIPSLIKCLRKVFTDKGIYESEMFQYHQMTINPTGVTYRNTLADMIIFCEGPRVVKNPYWNYLTFKPVKGELLEIQADLPEDLIINRGVFILPKNGKFTVGSTYDHQNLDYVPSAEGIKNLKDRLSRLYQADYSITNETAGVRPATYDRRPFIGVHPEHKSVGIFNGFGTKGVSLVPYFARQLVNYLSTKEGLISEVRVDRIDK